MFVIENVNKQHKNYYLFIAATCVLLACRLTFYYFFSAPSTSETTSYIYIDTDDNADSVVARLTPITRQHSFHGLTTLIRHIRYAGHVCIGRYAIKSREGAFSVLRHLKNGMQEPASLIILTVRAVERLSAELAKHLMLDSTTLASALKSDTLCQKYGYGTTAITCMFIPNTYDIYQNVNTSKLSGRMRKESNNFWDADGKAKAQRLKLFPSEVITLASIVGEETTNNGEGPMITGMYYNQLVLCNARYFNGMPLRADPTIRLAWKDFDLRRIYNKLLIIKSPCNIYVNMDLPLGPIRIASIANIEPVLNLTHHDYLYMYAKEDLSGTYDFARTYAGHKVNAARYAAALNERGIQ